MRATICGLGDQDAEERLNAVLLALGADWHDAADAAAPGGREIRIAGHAARVFTEGDALALEGGVLLHRRISLWRKIFPFTPVLNAQICLSIFYFPLKQRKFSLYFQLKPIIIARLNKG